MSDLFLALMFISMFAFILGMIHPNLAIYWGADEQKTRGKVALVYLGSIITFFILFGVTSSGHSQKSDDINAELTSTQTNQSKTDQNKVKTYKSGQYKVGKDIPAGEYVAISKGDSYIEVSSDATGNFTSIIANDIFSNRSIISVSDDQFIKIQNGQLYAFNDAPKIQPQDGALPAGMYKVGVDFPPGEYKIISDGGDSYIEVRRDSGRSIQNIVSNDLFQGERYINVSDGQYIKLFKAKIKLNL